MERPGKHFLACAGFSGKEHRGARGSDLAGQCHHSPHGGMAAYDTRRISAASGRTRLRAMPSQRTARGNGNSRARLARSGNDFIKTERFQPVVARSKPHQTPGFIRGPPFTDHDDRRKIRIVSAHGQQILNLKSRQGGTRKNQAGAGLAYKYSRSFQIFGERNFKARITQLRENAGYSLGRSEKKKALR